MSIAVSVIVPCYNVAPYLDACMESLVKQTLRDIEIICVNDGSTDHTLLLLRAWEAGDGRIRIIDRENGGLSAARNSGMDAARGEYIGFVDPDDYVELSMYARLLEEVRNQKAEVVACGYTGFSDKDGTILEKWSITPAPGRDDEVQTGFFHENSVWKRMAPVAWNKLYKREFLEQHRLRFESSFKEGEDDAFWMMVLAHASRLAVIPERLYWYRRQREGAISLAWEEDGCPILLVADRVVHVMAYWRKCGWLEAGLERGWVFHILWSYLLVRLISGHQDLPRLSQEEWLRLHEKFREAFSLAGGVDRFRNLDKWNRAFCLLLSRPVDHSGCLSRAGWSLLSRCRGRRGRYYALRLLLASCRREK